MEKKKCGQCGLVNWAGVMECARCGAFVSQKQQAVGRNPNDGATESNGFNPLRLGALLIVVLVGALIAYSAFSVGDPAKPVASSPALQLSPGEAMKVYQAGLESQRRDQAVLESYKESANTQPAFWNDPKNPKSRKTIEEFRKSVEDCPTRYLHNNPGGGKTCTFPK